MDEEKERTQKRAYDKSKRAAAAKGQRFSSIMSTNVCGVESPKGQESHGAKMFACLGSMSECSASMDVASA